MTKPKIPESSVSPWVGCWQENPYCPACCGELEAQADSGKTTGRIHYTDYRCIECKSEITNIHNITVNFTVKSDFVRRQQSID